MDVHDDLVDTTITALRPGPRRVRVLVKPAWRYSTPRHADGGISGGHPPDTPADHSPGSAPELAGR